MRKILLVLAVFACAVDIATAQEPRQRQQTAKGLDWVPFEPGTCSGCEGKKVEPCTTCNEGRTELPTRCMECRGKKVAPCRDCGGTGKRYDTLVKLRCPRCDARGFFKCLVCDGRTHLGNDTRRGAPCRTCKKKGGFACKLCKGKRLVVVPVGAKPLEKMSVAELEAAKKRLRSATSAAESFVKDEDKRFIQRHYEAAVEKVVAFEPAWKPLFKEVTKFLKAIDKQRDLRQNQEPARKRVRQWSLSQFSWLFGTTNNYIEACLENLRSRK